MSNNIEKIREILNEIEQSPANRNMQQVPEILKTILIDRFVRMGGVYRPHFNVLGWLEYKKFFAFKVLDITKLSPEEILERADYVEKTTKETLEFENVSLDCMEFNFTKVEALRDNDSFSDLVRGLFLFRRVEA